VGPGARLDRCRKSGPTGIRSPDLPARSESLYRLRYPGSLYQQVVQLIVNEGYVIPIVCLYRWVLKHNYDKQISCSTIHIHPLSKKV
jgi:hypothetical protein